MTCRKKSDKKAIIENILLSSGGMDINKMANKGFFAVNKSVSGKIILLVTSALIFASCTEGGGHVTVQPTGIPSELQDQLDRTGQSNITSANNAILQAKVVYAQLVGRWNSNSPLDIEAFRKATAKLLPPLFIVAQSLSSDAAVNTDKQSLAADFKEVYYNSLTNMLRGINNNLLIYQGFLENSQITNATAPDNPFPTTDEGIATLANIFVGTEATELFVAQLGQFTTISPTDETAKLLAGLKNQQTTIINGIINYTSQNGITKDQAKTAYQIIVKSLTSPNLLNALTNLAITIYGKDNVSFRQDELTSAQSNPNLVVMVIREENSIYRLISLENNRVVNRVSNDTRGLSASDLLNQSNVNVVRVQP